MGSVVMCLKKIFCGKALSHDRDLKSEGFGFQQRFRPVIMFEMFSFIMLLGCRICVVGGCGKQAG